jgi:hypothetical protein
MQALVGGPVAAIDIVDEHLDKNTSARSLRHRLASRTR